METPIIDFVKSYCGKNTSRLHMPGHKGAAFLGCESLDITEINNADSLYDASGIIAQSEQNAAFLFGTQATFFSTEGSSQCIRAMLFLAMQCAPKTKNRPFVFASRNAHKTFITAAALLNFNVEWLFEDTEINSICACNITSKHLENAFSAQSEKPFAVYVTSPDYLGNTLDISALASVCNTHNVPLLVDNAHGAYHNFLKEPCHAIALGASICCDSAHKTLPVLTGGAYLHIAKTADKAYAQNAKQALALFGSTSPSYLILQSLDLCNAYLCGEYKKQLASTALTVEKLKLALQKNAYTVLKTEPLKLCISAKESGTSGYALAEALRHKNVECEYADPDFLVLMFTPQNKEVDYERVISALGKSTAQPFSMRTKICFEAPKKAMSIREAMFARAENVPVTQALGKICAAPTVSCPPAIPVVVSGEIITEKAIEIFEYYEIDTVSVMVEE